jgi:hypothetical protein
VVAQLGERPSTVPADSLKHLLRFSTYDASFILDLARYYKFDMPKAASARRPNKSDVVDEFVVNFLQ